MMQLWGYFPFFIGASPKNITLKIDYISGKKIRVAFSKPWLADEADVDSYLGELKKALMKEIEAGKRIQV
ncbi:MAG: hypothetical protein ABIL06_15115 [Pseudomonadota bacterium]